jgi:PPOX class probable F420-dependent enzyme
LRAIVAAARPQQTTHDATSPSGASAYTLAVRRNLQPSELGDLLDRPLNAVLGVYRLDGSILLTPVWHLFKQGVFYFQIPGGDRKIAMLQRDPRCSLLVAENEHPYRAIEARGEGRMSTDDYQDLGMEIVRRYIEAYDPRAKVSDYLLEGGLVVRIEPTSMRAWDYADAGYV